MRILIPAFMISELRRGFEMGFLIALPFLVIDMIVCDHHNVHGHDDVAALGHIAADQSVVLHSHRRLEHAHRQSHPLL